jgi:hypothetical protein
VRGTYLQHGFRLVHQRQLDEWAVLILQRPSLMAQHG